MCEFVYGGFVRVDYKSVGVCKMYASGNCSLSRGGGGGREFLLRFFVCYLFEKSVRLIQYKDMKVINLCFFVVVVLSSKNTSEFGHF